MKSECGANITLHKSNIPYMLFLHNFLCSKLLLS